MPLTIAHPAAGYPLKRWLARPGALEAFVIGSMTPDLPYFVPFGSSGAHSHSLAGLFSYCIPAGTIVWALYQVLFRDMLRALLPASILARQRHATRPTGARAILRAIGFVSVGAATHISWDLFTHQTWIVRSVPALGAWVGFGPAFSLPVYLWLQYGSTVIGLGGIAFWFRQWLRTAPAGPDVAPDPALPAYVRAALWTLLLVPGTATALAMVARGVRAAPPQTLRALHQIVGRSLFASGTVSLGTLLALSIVWWVGCRISASRASS
jgi:hypothetical protein